MNNKGATEGMGYVGVILVAFVAIVVGVALFQSSAQAVGSSVNTVTLTNVTLPTFVNGTPFYLTEYRALENVVFYNYTGGEVILDGNYTVENNVVNNGALSVKITPKANLATWTPQWNISAVAQPVGYIDDAGGRGIAYLVVIFSALAIAVVALVPTLRSGVMNMVGK